MATAFPYIAGYFYDVTRKWGSAQRRKLASCVFHRSTLSCYLNLVSPKIQHTIIHRDTRSSCVLQAVLPLQGRVEGHYLLFHAPVLNAALTISLLSGGEFVDGCSVQVSRASQAVSISSYLASSPGPLKWIVNSAKDRGVTCRFPFRVFFVFFFLFASFSFSLGRVWGDQTKQLLEWVESVFI